MPGNEPLIRLIWCERRGGRLHARWRVANPGAATVHVLATVPRALGPGDPLMLEHTAAGRGSSRANQEPPPRFLAVVAGASGEIVADYALPTSPPAAFSARFAWSDQPPPPAWSVPPGTWTGIAAWQRVLTSGPFPLPVEGASHAP